MDLITLLLLIFGSILEVASPVIIAFVAFVAIGIFLTLALILEVLSVIYDIICHIVDFLYDHITKFNRFCKRKIRSKIRKKKAKCRSAKYSYNRPNTNLTCKQVPSIVEFFDMLDRVDANPNHKHKLNR